MARNILISFEMLQHFVNTVTRLLLSVDGAHAACCEEMATAMTNSESAALKGLQVCIDTILAEVSLLPGSDMGGTHRSF